MAYITKEKKAIIIARVKAATPKGWRVTFRMRHSSTIICTIRQADVDILAAVEAAYATHPSYETSGPVTHIQSLSPTTILELPDSLRKPLSAMYAALYSENYDNSDISTDYFDVGYYAHIAIGEWDKPMAVVTGAVVTGAVAGP